VPQNVVDDGSFSAFQISEGKARFVLTNIQAMEIVVNVGMDGTLSPNTVTTTHMGRIYQWFICPDSSAKGGLTKNMFKIRPRSKDPKRRFPYVPFASRRFRRHKNEEARKGEKEGFFDKMLRTLTETARKSRLDEIEGWKMVKRKLEKKRQRILSEKGDQDSFVYDVSPSLSATSEESKPEVETDNLERWTHVCDSKEPKKNPSNLGVVSGLQQSLRSGTQSAPPQDANASVAANAQTPRQRRPRSKALGKEMDSSTDMPVRRERSSRVNLHSKRTIRRLEVSSSEVVTLPKGNRKVTYAVDSAVVQDSRWEQPHKVKFDALEKLGKPCEGKTVPISLEIPRLSKMDSVGTLSTENRASHRRIHFSSPAPPWDDHSTSKASHKEGVCFDENAVTYPRGSDAASEKHFRRINDRIFFPAHSIGVVARSSKNGKMVETFLFNPYWPSSHLSSRGASVERSSKTDSKSLDESVSEPLFKKKVTEHRQSPVIAKCFARIRSRKRLFSEAKNEAYFDAEKNRRSVVVTERILVQPRRQTGLSTKRNSTRDFFTPIIA